LYENAGSFRGEAAVSTLIYRTTVNRSLNILRRKKFLLLFADDEEGNAEIPARETESDGGTFCAEDREYLRPAGDKRPGKYLPGNFRPSSET